MRKQLFSITILALALLVPSLVFAGANKFAAAKALSHGDNTVIVPLEISNDVELSALDIPLSFSEGVTLKEVTFNDTRVEYFDFKMARIDNDSRTVVIGLIPMFSAEQKPDLAVGEGTVANLVFEINDPSVNEITVEPVRLENPIHELVFVYHDENRVIRTFSPELGATTVSMATGADASLPDSYALSQNYPNPFNPSTEISFALPIASDVTLEVYNVLGQKVATLVDGAMDAGTHYVTFDADSYSSGVYFYRLATNSFTETKKMMLLK